MSTVLNPEETLKKLKENQKKYHRAWYDKNLEKLKETVKCDICGHIVKKYSEAKHKESKVHMNALKDKKPEINKLKN